MAKFIISSDTCCDYLKSDLKNMNVHYIPLAYFHDGKEIRDEFDSEKEYKNFYESIRKGALPKTSLLNENELEEYFDLIMSKEEGDLIHISLSSGLSGTYDNAVTAAKKIEEKYKGRKIYAIDSLGATRGMAMLIDVAVKARDDGKTAVQTAELVTDVLKHAEYIVIANNLNHLKRGGRVSATSAFVGSLLHIKPMIKVSSDGKLEVTSKVIGLKKALKFMLNYIKERYNPVDNDTMYIAHADCIELAEELKAMVTEEYKNIKVDIGYIGPIIGTHTGCGTMTIVFKAKDFRVN